MRTYDTGGPLAEDVDHDRAAMADNPRWVRPALLALLLLTAVAYVWTLAVPGCLPPTLHGSAAAVG
jgi:hypothetical protein